MNDIVERTSKYVTEQVHKAYKAYDAGLVYVIGVNPSETIDNLQEEVQNLKKFIIGIDDCMDEILDGLAELEQNATSRDIAAGLAAWADGARSALRTLDMYMDKNEP